jgi:DNA/RNA-binding domain of Phe-tRNA-synthetase-like protein
MTLTVDPHPHLELAAFVTVLPRPLSEVASPAWLVDLLRLDAAAPVARSEELRAAVRDVLRHGGYKPTGRGKPASEYLVRAAEEGALRSINAVVDACNAVSLHSGIPISVVDLDLAREPLRAGLAPAGVRYVFNASGQEIDVTGLLCLFDAEGPCANAVKDSQRTKTGASTRRTLSLLWGPRSIPGAAPRAAAWYRELLERVGAATADVPPAPA